MKNLFPKFFMALSVGLLLASCALFNQITTGNSSGIPTPGVGQWVTFGGSEPPVTNNQFVFPSQQSGQIAGYIYTKLPVVPKVGQTLTLVYDVIGNNPQWVQAPASGGNSETDINPPTLHLFLWRKGDDLSCSNNGTGQGGYADYRLFAGRTPLVLGSGQTISVPLDSGLWTGCYGQPPVFMQDELNDLLGAGITFGGQYFAGHGIYLNGGSAIFYIRSFGVN